MKKIIALVLTVVLLLTIAATCFAGPHTHAWHQASYTRENLSAGSRWVDSCNKKNYGHYHKYPRYKTKTVYVCSCGAIQTNYSGVLTGGEYCP